MPAEPPPPLSLRDVRVLDLEAGGFSDATSLLVSEGRIQWIGAGADRPLPPNVTVLEGGACFAPVTLVTAANPQASEKDVLLRSGPT